MKKSFVFIFRQGPTRLSDEEQKQRTEEVRGWGLEQTNRGRNIRIAKRHPGLPYGVKIEVRSWMDLRPRNRGSGLSSAAR